MLNPLPLSRSQQLQWLTALILFLHWFIRAMQIPITPDEAATCLTHVPRTFQDILIYEHNATPNNHILNTLLVKLFVAMFGMYLPVIRIPALLGGLLYLWSSWQFSRALGTKVWSQWVVWVLLLGNPFVHEFFSLSRGYGLSVGLLSVTVWYLYSYAKEGLKEDLWRVQGLQLLSVLASFTLLNVVPALFAIQCWLIWSNKSTRPIRDAWVSAGGLFLVGLFSYLPITAMRAQDEFRFWGNTGFYNNTLVPLLRSSLQLHEDGWQGQLLFSALVLVIFLFSATLLWGLWRWYRGNLANEFVALQLLLPGTLLVNIAQHYLLGTPYLDERTSTFLYLLFALQLIPFVTYLGTKKGILPVLFPILFAFLLFVNHYRNWNTNATTTWYFDQYTLKVLDKIRTIHLEEQRAAPFLMDAHWASQSSYYFHIHHGLRAYDRFVNIVPYHDHREPKGNTEFFMTHGYDEVNALRDRYDIVKQFDGSGVFCLMRQKPEFRGMARDTIK